MESLPTAPEKVSSRAWDALLFLLCLVISLIVFAVFKATVGVDQSWVAGIIGAIVLAAIITAVSYFTSRNDGVAPAAGDVATDDTTIDAVAADPTDAHPVEADPAAELITPVTDESPDISEASEPSGR